MFKCVINIVIVYNSLNAIFCTDYRDMTRTVSIVVLIFCTDYRDMTRTVSIVVLIFLCVAG